MKEYVVELMQMLIITVLILIGLYIMGRIVMYILPEDIKWEITKMYIRFCFELGCAIDKLLGGTVCK